MKLSVITIVTCYLFVSHQVEIQKIPDYSWTEFRGAVPTSALRVNSGECNVRIYIGMAWFKAGLLVGNLTPNDTTVRVTAQNEISKTDQYPMILTSPHPHLYSWVPTTTETFEDTKNNCELVVGGVETGHTMYIGRHVIFGTMSVGKIYKYPERELVLPADNDEGEVRFTKFDVLAFNCKKSCR